MDSGQGMGHGSHFFFFINSDVCWIIAMLENSSPASILQTGIFIETCIPTNIYKSVSHLLSCLLYSYNPISAHYHLHISPSTLRSHCGRLGQVHAKHAQSNVIQTHFILVSSDQKNVLPTLIRLSFMFSGKVLSCSLVPFYEQRFSCWTSSIEVDFMHLFLNSVLFLVVWVFLYFLITAATVFWLLFNSTLMILYLLPSL